MIDDDTIERLLRRTFEAIATHATDTGEERPLARIEDRRIARRPFTRRLAALIVIAVAASVFGTVALLNLHHDKAARVETTRGASSASLSSTAHASTSTQPSVPSVIRGTEQTIASTKLPSSLAVEMGRDLVAGTHVESLSVNGSTPFAVSDVASFKYPPSAQFRWPEPATCVDYPGTLPIGGQGTGTQEQCVSLAQVRSGARHAVMILPTFPKPSGDTTVWSHLPTGTAFVTFTADAIATLWERPTQGTAGFVVDTPARYQGPSFRDAPSPIVRAYDAHGVLLAEVIAPRFPGDPVTSNGS
jgi:hypothetical protein